MSMSTQRRFEVFAVGDGLGSNCPVCSASFFGTEIHSAVQRGKSGRNRVKRGSVGCDRVLLNCSQTALQHDFMLSDSVFWPAQGPSPFFGTSIRNRQSIKINAQLHCAGLRACLWIGPDAELGHVMHKAEYIYKPNHQGDYDDSIQQAFDGSLHGYIAVDQPHQHSHNE